MKKEEEEEAIMPLLLPPDQVIKRVESSSLGFFSKTEQIDTKGSRCRRSRWKAIKYSPSCIDTSDTCIYVAVEEKLLTRVSKTTLSVSALY